MKKLLVTLVVLGTFSQAFAQKEYYSLSRSIRSLGMGGAFYALSNDESAMFYNPSGLSLYEGKWQLMGNINALVATDTLKALNSLKGSNRNVSETIDTLSQYQGKPLYAGAGLFGYYFRKHFGMGLLLADTKVDVSVLGKDLDSAVDLTAISDSGLFITYARPIGDPNLHVGLTTKGIVRAGGRQYYTLLDIAGDTNFKIDPQKLGGAGFGLDFDLGATYDIPESPIGLKSRVALVFNNLVGTKFQMAHIAGGQPPGLPRTVTVGTYTVFEGISFIDNFHVLVDFSEFALGNGPDPDLGGRTGNFFKHVNLGLEMPMNGWFVLRTGFHQGYWTGGVGINCAAFKLDFASYAEELGSSPGRMASRRYALRIGFGFGDTAPAAIRRPEIEVPPVGTPNNLPSKEPREVPKEVKDSAEPKSVTESPVEPSTTSEAPKED